MIEQIGADILLVLSSLFITFLIQKIIPIIFKIIPFAIFAGFVLILIKTFFFNLSENVFHYTDLFLAFIFGSFPLSINTFNKKFFKSVMPLWRYSLFQYLIQWGGSLLIVVLILKYFFNIGDEFGAYLPSGFAGGHGSAAVVGDLLYRGGIKDALSFTMFAATIGIICSVLGGICFSYFKKRKFNIKKVKSASHKNFVYKDGALLILSVLISFILKPIMYKFLAISVPAFVIAVLVSFIFRLFFGNCDEETLSMLSAFSTDLLVIIGMGAINFTVIQKSIIPLSVLFLFGLTQGIFVFLFLSKRVFKKEDAFEKALFTWGWSIGGLVIGLNLVQSLEKRNNERILEEFAMTYLLLSPIEISLLILSPWLLLNGYALYLGLLLFILAIILLIYMLRVPRSS